MARTVNNEDLKTRVHVLEEKLILDQKRFDQHSSLNERNFREVHELLRETTVDLKGLGVQVDRLVDVARDQAKSIVEVRVFQVKANLIFAFIGVVATGIGGFILKLIYDLIHAGAL